jgi:hypothetical protein
MAALAGYLIVASSLFGQAADVTIPADVLTEMQYLVGDWTMEGKLGEELHKAKFSHKWSSSRLCVNCDFVWSRPAETLKACQIIGWDGGTRELVVVEFGSDGYSGTARYKIKSPGVWEGQAQYGGPEAGEGFKASVRLEKRNQNEWVWTATDIKPLGKAPAFSKGVCTFRRVNPARK